MTITACVLCDECENVFAPERRQRRGGLSEAAHAAGWTSTLINGTWKNECPDHTGGNE